MNSPFLYRNIAVLTSLILVFAASSYFLLSPRVNTLMGRTRFSGRVLLRGFSILFTSISALVLFVGVWLFFLQEISDISQKSWKRSYEWHQIEPGTPKSRVSELIGAPFLSVSNSTGETATYSLTPIGGVDKGTIKFTVNPKEADSRVVEKTPDDATVAENFRIWWPVSTPSYDNYAEIVSDGSAFCAFYCLLTLATLSLFPFGLTRDKWTSRMMYAPLIALFFRLIYEHHNPEAWHFELFAVSPLYTIIIIAWLVRVSIVLVRE